MSCASCHNDGGHDGRVWDLTGLGEGLRNTIALRGRGGMGQGFLHWSGNFDEVQDFEGQIRTLAGGTGLMATRLRRGTRSSRSAIRRPACRPTSTRWPRTSPRSNAFAPAPARAERDLAVGRRARPARRCSRR